VDSLEALSRAIELAKAFSARIVLLHSYWVSLASANPELLPTDLLERLRADAQLELGKLEKQAAASSIRCESRLTLQPAVPAILEEARAIPAELVVMGTRGRSGIGHMLMGSVAERVVRLAPCAVLTVKVAAR
jgi:nucleotide-binding universal stress UspA family protein